MRVHHLNCASMHPPTVGEMVTHCLLVETESGPVLVDSGYGTDDIDRTSERLGSMLPLLLRPALQRSDERGLLAADEGPGPPVDGDIEVEARSQDVRPQEPVVPGLIQREVQPLQG